MSCSPWQECTNGASCSDLGLSLAWLQPTNGAKLGPAAAAHLGLQLQVTRLDGGTYPLAVPYALSGRGSGELTRNGSLWEAMLDAGIDDGPRTLTAGWVGGPQAQIGFTVIATPPSVQLFPEAAPVRAAQYTDIDGVARWKKHEVAPIQVQADRPLPGLGPSDFTIQGVAPSTACQRLCAAGASCYCFTVDLAQQPLPAAHGTVAVGLKPVLDAFGNRSQLVEASFEVTRFKWSRAVSAVTTSVPMGIAISPTGAVLVGASDPSNGTGVLTAYRPDGGVAWQNNYFVGTVTAGPMVGSQGVYFGFSKQDGGVSGQGGIIRRVDFDGQGTSDDCPANSNGGQYSGDLALAVPGRSEVPIGIYRDVHQHPAICPPGALNTVGPTPYGRPTVIVSGHEVFAAARGPSLMIGNPVWKFSSGFTPGEGLTAQGNLVSNTVAPTSLFILRADLLGGGGGLDNGGAFVFSNSNDAGVLSGSVIATEWGSDGGSPAIVGGSTMSPVVYAGTQEGAVVAASIDTTAPGFPPGGRLRRMLSTSESLSDQAPLLGRGGKLYVVGNLGVLHVLSTSTLAEEWAWAVPPPGPFASGTIAPLNLDLNRDALNPCGAGQPGVLYIAASSATTGTVLYAILVDSPGVDPSAPWPRHQHNPANTGNPDTGLAAYTCQ